MSVSTPIQLTLYDPQTDEEIKTYNRSFIPWGILKRALRLQKTLNGEEISEQDADEIAGLVVAVFGDQFSVSDLDNGADLGEMITVLNSVINRAAVFIEGRNPTIPAK